MKKITFISNNFQGGIPVYNQRLVDYINKSENTIWEGIHKIYNQYPSDFTSKRIRINKNENKIHSYKKLIQAIDIGANDIICCSNDIELEALNYFKFKGKILYFLHGDYPYYFKTAINFEQIIDGFACVSDRISENLRSHLPNRNSDIQTVKAILPEVGPISLKGKTGIIFVGRAEKAKGFEYIEPIYSELKSKGYNIPLAIYCQEPTNLSLHLKKTHPDIEIKYGVKNAGIISALRKSAILLFPSKAEGLPLVVSEAMQQGVVPITSNLPILQSLTKDCGFSFKGDDTTRFTDTIILLNNNIQFRENLGKNAIEKANNLFNPVTTLHNLQKLTILEKEKRFLLYSKHCSKLDHPMIPNWVTIILRLLKSKSTKLIPFNQNILPRRIK